MQVGKCNEYWGKGTEKAGTGRLRRLLPLLFVGVALLGALLALLQAQTGFHLEDFITTTYKDEANSTVLGWGSGQVSCPRRTPTLAGSFPTAGYARRVVIAGDYAYIANGGEGLLVVDISDPMNPTPAGSYDTTGSAYGVAVEGDYAYVADYGEGLVVVDISDPTDPTPAGSSYLGGLFGVTIDGDYAYVVGWLSFLVVDIRDPMNTTLAGSYDIRPHSAYDAVIEGDFAYVASGEQGLLVVDISDPTDPTLAGSYNTPGIARGVIVEGNYAYVGGSGEGVQVVDISDPTNPTLAGSYDTPGYAYGVVVEGDYAYVADYGDGVQVVDISNPTDPTLAGSYDTPGYAYGVVVEGNYAYVADYDQGLMVVQISDPVSPIASGSCDISWHPWGVAIDGDYAYVASSVAGLQVVDISDPSNPIFAGSQDIPSDAYGVVVEGDYAYIPARLGGLKVVDISDPTNPTLVVRYDPLGFVAYGVAIAGDYAYVAAGLQGMEVVEISDPTSPTFAGRQGTFGNALRVVVEGDYAYLGSDGYGLEVVDISDPTIPTFVGRQDFPRKAYDIVVEGDYAYVASDWRGLEVVDISDPTNPTLAGTYDTPGYARGVVVEGDYAYLVDHGEGLYVVDISDPTNPTTAWSYDNPGVFSEVVAIAGDYAYVGVEDEELQVIELQVIEVRRNRARQFESPCYAQSLDFVQHRVSFATLNSTATTPPDTDISYFLSNNGTNWDQVAPGLEHAFTTFGYQLMWRAEMTTSDSLLTPTVSEISVDYGTINTRPVADLCVGSLIGRGFPPSSLCGSECLKHLDIGIEQIWVPGSEVNFPIISIAGQGSYDAESDPLTYDWDIVFNSGAVIVGASSGSVNLGYFSEPGYYLVRLVVNDGFEDSLPAFASIQVFDEDVYTCHPDSAVVDLDSDAVPGSDVWVTLMDVTDPGETTVAVSTTAPAEGEPAFDVNGVYYDISTAADYSGPVTVCIKYDPDGLSLEDQRNLRLYHHEEVDPGPPPVWEWTNVTILPVDTGNNMICGRVSSLSWFAVGTNHPPEAVCRDVTVTANDMCWASASIDNGSWDPNGNDDLTFVQDPSGPYELGETAVTLTVTDSYGESDSCTATVTVTDASPPTIDSLAASPNLLWPPNHKMVPVEINVAANDVCDPGMSCRITEVSSNEPDDDYCEETGELTLNLRAERDGSGNGRIYTIMVECIDDSKNTSTGNATVTIPHDQGKGKTKKKD